MNRLNLPHGDAATDDRIASSDSLLANLLVASAAQLNVVRNTYRPISCMQTRRVMSIYTTRSAMRASEKFRLFAFPAKGVA